MWKKILLGLAVLIGLIVAIVMYATSGMSDVANEFFIYTKSKHFVDAYNMGSADFKKSVTEEQLKNFLVQNALTEYKNASWSERSIEGNIGMLKGTITTKTGSVIPITMKFTKNANDEWELYSIYKPAGGIEKEKPKAQSSANHIPSQDELIKLVQEATMVFAQSVKDKSMQKVYDNSADYFKKQTSVEYLDKQFGSFYKAGIDLSVLKDITPVLDDSPKVLKDGQVIVKGHYPTSPSVVYFNNSYYLENGKWKLSGIGINIR